jgi:hypothetical protein
VYSEHTDKQQFPRTLGVLEEYINKTVSYPQDVASICTTFAFTPPTRPTISKEAYDDETDVSQKMEFNAKLKTYMKRVEAIEGNSRIIYSVIWGQCSQMMQSKLETLPSYEKMRTNCDCASILKEIQGITHRFEGTRNIFVSLDDAWHRYYIFKQHQNQSLHDFHKEYQGILQVLEHYGASFGTDMPLQKAVREAASVTPTVLMSMIRSAAKKKFAAVGLLKRADIHRYGSLLIDLENSFSRGVDQYPVDLTAAYNLLLNYKPKNTPTAEQSTDTPNPNGNNIVSGVTFLQNSSGNNA